MHWGGIDELRMVDCFNIRAFLILEDLSEDIRTLTNRPFQL